MPHGWIVFKQNLRTSLIDNLIKLIHKSIYKHKINVVKHVAVN